MEDGFRRWGGPHGFISEFVPEGQQIENWEEMVAQQITFTEQELSGYVSNWKRLITQADPNVLITEVFTDTDSQTFSYRSEPFNEFSIRRFFKGPDGIYAIAYHVRLNQMDEDRVELWSDIIAKSTLDPNPQKR